MEVLFCYTIFLHTLHNSINTQKFSMNMMMRVYMRNCSPLDSTMKLCIHFFLYRISF